MPKLTEHMKQLIQEQPVAYVATADAEGRPNVSPKGTLHILDNDTLVFADLFSLKTRANIEVNPQMAVTIVNTRAYEGYQFRGRAELVSEGPLYDEVAGKLAGNYGPQPMELWFEKAARGLLAAFGRAGRDRVKPKNALVLHVEEIWNLAPGHETEVWR